MRSGQSYARSKAMVAAPAGGHWRPRDAAAWEGAARMRTETASARGSKAVEAGRTCQQVVEQGLNTMLRAAAHIVLGIVCLL